MDFKILTENKNNILKRKELTIELNHSRSATVSKTAVQQAVAAKEKVPATHVHVEDVQTGSGTTTAVAHVEVYEKPVSGAEAPKEEAKAEETTQA